MHYNLPKVDQTAQLDKIFIENYKTQKTLSKTIIKTYDTTLIFITMITICYVLADQGTSLGIFFIVASLVNQQVEITSQTPPNTNNYTSFATFIAITLTLQIITAFLKNYNSLELSRLSIRIKNSIISMVIQKSLKVSILNSKTHTEGELINFVQVDANKFEMSVFQFIRFQEAILSLIIGSCLVYYVAGFVVWIVFAVFILSTITMGLITKLYQKFQTRLMKHKDERICCLSNALNNIMYIKTAGIENYFHALIYKLR